MKRAIFEVLLLLCIPFMILAYVFLLPVIGVCALGNKVYPEADDVYFGKVILRLQDVLGL